jgi:chaperone modulatory protein CbpM
MDPIDGELVEHTTISLHQLCVVCGMHLELAIEMVSCGVIEAAGERPESWRFDLQAQERSRKAVRMHRDLGIDWAGLALVLDLLEENERLHARTAFLEAALRHLESSGR